jgi:membrane protease YdiL (CAAX protease family)
VALISFFAANAVVIAAAVAFRIPIGHLDQLTPIQIAILTVAQDVTLALALVALLRWWPKVRAADLGVRTPVAVRTGLVTGLVLWGASLLIANAQAAVVGAHPQALVVAAASHRSPEALVLDLVFAAGLVAVVEELFFRAVIFGLLRQRLPFAVAAALSSVLFAVAHEIAAWIPVFILGVGLCWLYEKRHSLWTNALAHGTVNAVSFIVLFLLPDLGS